MSEKMKRPSGYIVNFESAWNRIRRPSKIFRRKSKQQLSKGNDNSALRASLKEREIDLEKLRSKSRSGSSSMLKKKEVQLSLYQKLHDKLFINELTPRKYSDIIRTAHVVKIETFDDDMQLHHFVPKEEITEADIPDRQTREMRRMGLVIKKLLEFFGTEEEADNLIDDLDDFLDAYDAKMIDKKHFNLHKLFKKLHESRTKEESLVLLKVRTVLKFLHISVVIFAIEEMRAKLDLGINHLTRDLRSGGWSITVTLDQRFLEIAHERRECALKQKRKEDYWEICYKVTSSFDYAMKNLSQVRMVLNDLKFGEECDKTVKDEISEKFSNGYRVIC